MAVSFHWDDETDGAPPERRSAFLHYERALPEVARAFPGALGHAHPRWFDRLAGPFERAGLEPVRSFDEVEARAGVYAADNSSTIPEFASLDRPVVVLNCPHYRRDVDLWWRFWTHADIGMQVDDPSRLVATIRRALLDPPEQRALRHRAVRAIYAACDGRASERAARAIELRLDELEDRDARST